MKNIERLAQYTFKYGSESFLVHSIPGTAYWLICQKISADEWSLTLGDPMGTVNYNLGSVNNAQHLEIWSRLTAMELGNKISETVLANKLKSKIRMFIKDYERNYHKFTKKYERRTTNRNKKRRKLD